MAKMGVGFVKFVDKIASNGLYWTLADGRIKDLGPWD